MAHTSQPDLDLVHQAFRDDDVALMEQILERNPGLKDRVNEPSGPFGAPAVTCVKSAAMLDVLLAAGADIDAKSDWWAGGFGLLHLAAPDVAHAAIERGAKVDAHAAARLGMLDRLQELVEADPSLVHARGGDGQTPLHFASTVEVAAYLLDKGADIDARDIDHVSTPSQWMVGERQEVAQFLVSRGCSTDVLMAAALGDLALARKILDDDPEAVRMRVSDEWFAMIGGANGGTIYQWQLGWYVSAHQVARRWGHDDVFDLLWDRSPDDVRLVTACWLGNESEVDRLLASIPDLGSKLFGSERRQAAHAARNDDLPALRLMLKAGLPLDARSQHNATPLHWAAWNGNLEMLRLILASGADIDDRENDFDGTPLGWAVHGSVNGWRPSSGDYPGVVRALLQAGASRPEHLGGTPEVRAVLADFGVTD